MLHKKLLFNVKKVDAQTATIEGVFSTADEDRHGNVVLQNFDLSKFKQNPVILNSHNYGDATEVVGKANKISVKDGVLQGTIQFAVFENPKAKIIFDLYAGGYLKAFSIGFIPKKFSDDMVTIEQSELLEISAVSVPANAYALAKQKGIDVTKLYDQPITKSDETPNDDEQTPAGDGDGGQGGDNDGGESGDQPTGEQDAGAPKPNEVGGDGTGDPITKEFENWSEGNEVIRLKVRDIAEFEDGSFARVIYKASTPKISALIAQPKGDSVKKIQTLIFSKDEGWTVDDAKKYWSQNQHQIINWSNAIEEPQEKSATPAQKLVKAISGMVKDQEEKDVARKQKLLKVLKAVDEYGEVSKVETRTKSGKAEEKKILNQTIRKMLKQKQLLN